jgi:F-type H+-transporting ATPase subunit delta
LTSAQALIVDEVAKLKAELTAAMKTYVNLESRVDDCVLGGLVVRVGSRMVDSSLKTKLQNLRFAMRGVD